MREGSLFERDLPDGRNLAVVPLTFGRARMLVSDNARTSCADDAW